MAESESRPVCVDMFCGSGGESQGIAWAAEKAGIRLEMFAINHWEQAIKTHRANFPDAEHICRDVADIHPPDLIPGGKIALLWMSPECTNHSPARGDKPMDNQSRCSAFTLFDWINKMTVDRVIVENVPAFENWGPLDEETKRPIAGREGETFKAWLALIRSFDYTVDYRSKVNAADYGVPTTRRRLFVQAVRNGSGKSILWPEPSHARTGPNRVLTQELPRWIPARDIINWSLPSESIFSRRRPLAARTMNRIREGLARFGGSEFLVCMEHGGRVVSADVPMPTITTAKGGAIGVAQPFLLEYYGNGGPRPISDPLPTVTTRDRFALIEPRQDNGIDVRFRMLTPRELAAAQSFPRDYKFLGTREEIVKQIGNAVCPLMAEALTAEYMRELAIDAMPSELAQSIAGSVCHD